ncbi:uncharacterized protein Z519_04865 [Cladophialophora bantiana CBS 173.52]|uniref:N-acetyltransferase domain-containing protein n=1 Tax=Cladophialophora bantiana (strain ATCC 10958 / CBS 173.52 / CDC B-1940 / NIH 8579) TaxID=1442370 RepID=A0A0D2G8D1_CLAB1|nr:uncharacterized protein Z519_04865 [Cladophialophora bantiana CBS 173.52]KIW94887.1 hypothetical protein Z519_04865 [Cladophialophora bantiana CBS 173.52]
MSHVAPAVETSKTWTRDGFIISTDTSLIPIDALNQAFASEEMYWASPLPEPVMRDMLDNSLSFGLYSPTPEPPPLAGRGQTGTALAPSDPAETLRETATSVKPDVSGDNTTAHPRSEGPNREEQTPSLIGFARCITDRVTLLYLTDVFILPEWQGRGLGKWLISCVQEVVEDMPHLRRSMCIVGHGKERSMEFYGKLMKMTPVKEPVAVLNWKGPGNVF